MEEMALFVKRTGTTYSPTPTFVVLLNLLSSLAGVRGLLF